MTAVARLDLHVHGERSPDSRLPLTSIVARVRFLRLQGFALTDHNTVDGHPALRQIATKYPDLLFVPGVEISTMEGHLLVYGISTLPPVHRPLDETVAWVQANGGEPVLAHPFRRIHGVGGKVALRADVGTVEALNGQNSPGTNRCADELAHGRNLGVTGGSDGHTPRGVGRAYTTFESAPASTDDVLEAIRRRRTRTGGSSLGFAGHVLWAARNGLLRTRRGFREV